MNNNQRNKKKKQRQRQHQRQPAAEVARGRSGRTSGPSPKDRKTLEKPNRQARG
jgi:hypothetical protein